MASGGGAAELADAAGGPKATERRVERAGGWGGICSWGMRNGMNQAFPLKETTSRMVHKGPPARCPC